MIQVPVRLGLLALAGVVGAESMGAPVPGETALIGAAILAHDGQLSIWAVVLVAAGAAIIGDNVGYLIGRRGGRWLLQRPGPLLAHRARLLARGEAFFARHGPKAVFLARFVAGVRVTGAWMAGVNRMRWQTFLLWNALGGVAWAVLIGLMGFMLGGAAERLLGAAGLAAIGAGAGVTLIVGVALVLRRSRRRRGLEVSHRFARPHSLLSRGRVGAMRLVHRGRELLRTALGPAA
ncbi:MAG: DedA family protein [Thermoleophilaceae bacterium]|nr:DedA family protein [Thermoleophilaceae bacterium]